MFKKDGSLFESLSKAETFKKYYTSLAENLVLKLAKPPNNFGIQPVKNYYNECNLKKRLLFQNIESDKVFKMLKNLDESKAPGIVDLSRIFLRNGSSLLATPMTQLCNLSIFFL